MVVGAHPHLGKPVKQWLLQLLAASWMGWPSHPLLLLLLLLAASWMGWPSHPLLLLLLAASWMGWPSHPLLLLLLAATLPSPPPPPPPPPLPPPPPPLPPSSSPSSAATNVGLSEPALKGLQAQPLCPQAEPWGLPRQVAAPFRPNTQAEPWGLSGLQVPPWRPHHAQAALWGAVRPPTTVRRTQAEPGVPGQVSLWFALAELERLARSRTTVGPKEPTGGGVALAESRALSSAHVGGGSQGCSGRALSPALVGGGRQGCSGRALSSCSRGMVSTLSLR